MVRAAKIENGKVVNIIKVNDLADFPDYIDATGASIGDTWDGNTFTSSIPISPVPQIITRMQAKMALQQAGLLNSIQAHMDDPDMNPMYKIAWNEAQEFSRNSPTIAALQGILGLTDESIDNLFRSGSLFTA